MRRTAVWSSLLSPPSVVHRVDDLLADLEEFATRLDLHDVEERLIAEVRMVHDLDRRFQAIEERITQIEKRAH